MFQRFMNFPQPAAGLGKEYKGVVFLQWELGGRAEVELNVAQGNSALVDWVFSSSINITGLDPLHLGGKLVRLEDRTSANVDWKFNQKSYAAVVEYFPGENVTSDKTLLGSLNVDTTKYEGNVQMKNTEDEKSIVIDMKATQHIYLLLQSQNNYNDLKFEFAWDKDRDPNKRFFFETSLHQDNLLAHLMLYEYEGKVNGSYTSDSVDASLQWGEKRADVKAKCVLSWTHLEYLLELKTSNPLFEHIKTHLQLILNPQPDGSSVLTSKVGLHYNHVLRYKPFTWNYIQEMFRWN